MMFDTEKLRWNGWAKGEIVWVHRDLDWTPPSYVDVDLGHLGPDHLGPPYYFGTKKLIGNLDVDLSSEDFLEWEKAVPRLNESDQEYDDRTIHSWSSKSDYTPGNIQILFQRFANTEPTKDGIMNFAETFGLLGLQTHYGWLPGEPFSTWVHEILSMRYVLRLWSAIKREDKQEIEAIYSEFDGIHRNKNPGTTRWAWGEISETLLLSQHNYGLAPKFQIRPDAASLQLWYSPESLIGLIWLQFMLVVIGGNRWNVCQYCGEPFEVGRKGQRACSESHRQMAYRKRKQSKK